MGLTAFPNGISSFGVPVTGSAGHNVCMGKIWFVDGTNGSDGNSGLLPTQAFKTIQKAITIQGLQTSGLGDIIYVAPGSYAESLTGDLTRVAIVGIPSDYPWHVVSIRPTAGSAYTGTTFEAMFKNLTILSSSGTNKTLPAMHFTNMRYTIIEDCHFVGRDATCEEAIQIGPTTDLATDVAFDMNIIRRNKIDTWYGVASEFTYGIKLGSPAGGTGDGHHVCVGTTIENNDIFVTTTGIHLNTNQDTARHTVIRGNVIDSGATANGCATAGIEIENASYVVIVDNRINATDAIKTASAPRVLANLVTNAGTSAGENPVYSV